jgi:hypothetical protein
LSESASEEKRLWRFKHFSFKAGPVLPVNLATNHQNKKRQYLSPLPRHSISSERGQIAGVGFFLGFFASLFFFCWPFAMMFSLY